MEKLIISACICGAEVTKEQNPNVPYTVENQRRYRSDKAFSAEGRRRHRVC